jgi:hypothetical protein
MSESEQLQALKVDLRVSMQLILTCLEDEGYPNQDPIDVLTAMGKEGR